MPKVPDEAPIATERLGINLFDLERVSPDLMQRLFAGRLDTRRESVFRVNDKTEHTGIPLTGDLLEAATALDILLSECRREGDRLPRIYVHYGSGWVSRSPDALTIAIGERLYLNPLVFLSTKGMLPEQAPEPKAMDW